MCAHFQTSAEIKSFYKKVGVRPESIPESPRLVDDAKPTDPVAVVLRNPKSGELEVRYPRWGLVPHWADDPKIGTKMINARAETLAEKPAFREAFRKRRCIMPLESFFEFDRTSRYRVTLRNCDVMGVAGLWEWRKAGEGPPLVTCTMVTTVPNELIATVHDRMPAILRPDDYQAWLDPDKQETSELLPMLAPMEASELLMEFDGYKKTAKKADLELPL